MDNQYKIMKKALENKFEKGTQLAYMLVQTGNSILIEDSPTDKYWGRGRFGNGQNMLGKMLMDIRTELTKE